MYNVSGSFYLTVLYFSYTAVLYFSYTAVLYFSYTTVLPYTVLYNVYRVRVVWLLKMVVWRLSCTVLYVHCCTELSYTALILYNV